jgi:histidinol phosphatase-like enzyme
MLLDAASRLGLDLSHSIMVGDHASDMQAARSAGLACYILVSDAAEEKAKCPAGTRFASHLMDVPREIEAAMRDRDIVSPTA